MLGNTDIRNPKKKALMSELGLSEEAIEVLKSLRRVRVHEESEHDKRTLLDVLDGMMTCNAAKFEDLLKNIGAATSPEIRYQGKSTVADPYDLYKSEPMELLFYLNMKFAEASLESVIFRLFKKDALSIGPVGSDI